MKADIDALRDAIAQARRDLDDLESHLPHWSADSLAGAKKPRAIARRIVLSAQRVESLTREYTFAPGT